MAKNSRRHHGIHHRRHNLYFFFNNRLLLLRRRQLNNQCGDNPCRRATEQTESPLATMTTNRLSGRSR